jgi:steroid delta-isomerase-like uncharacterized protein
MPMVPREKIVVLVLGLALLSSTNPLAAFAAAKRCNASQMARHEATARIVFDEILSKGHFDENEAIYDPGFVAHSASGPVGRKEDRAAGQALRAMAPDLRMSVLQLVADCTKVAVLWEATGTNSGGGMGLPANGAAVKAKGSTIFRMQNGKIVEEWTVFDQLTMLRQLGALGQ